MNRDGGRQGGNPKYNITLSLAATRISSPLSFYLGSRQLFVVAGTQGGADAWRLQGSRGQAIHYPALQDVAVEQLHEKGAPLLRQLLVSEDHHEDFPSGGAQTQLIFAAQGRREE